MASKLTFDELVVAARRLQKLVCNHPLLCREDVILRYGFSESEFERLLRQGRIPRPVRFNGPLWKLEDLEAAEKAAQVPGPGSG